MDIIRFLQCRGYTVQAYHYTEPAQQGFLIDEPAREVHTFTATRNGEEQSPDNEFLKVFEKELKKVLKEFL